MTVCVAAICDGDTIFGASDTMITAGDIQFEPTAPKITILTTSMAVMTAGDSTLHAEIIQKVQAEVNERIQLDPDEWLNIKDIAELYGQYYNEARSKRAEKAILAPLGLDTDSFIRRQREMSPDFVRQLGTEMINFNPGDIEAIVAGVDNSGAHLWVVKNEDIACYDKVGFTAIGAGEWHAKSQFMFSGHTRYRPVPETLFLTFTAKKRAEVAPGVGTETDMFMVGPQLGSFNWIGYHVLDRLEDIYKDVRRQEQQIVRLAEERVNQYVEEIARAATVKEQAAIPEDGGGDTPFDQKELRDGVEEDMQGDRREETSPPDPS